MGGTDLNEMVLRSRGPEHDRRWMLVDHDGGFISQREHPQLARWKVTVDHRSLQIHSNVNGDLFSIKEALPEDGEIIPVSIWRDTVNAIAVSQEADGLLSEKLKISCRLVYMGASAHRKIDQDYAEPQEEVSFADGFPYLITTTASIQSLSMHNGYAIQTNRFRPNIVIENKIAWEEDNWSGLQIGNATFRLPKPCARCEVPGVDQKTGAIDHQILRSLAKVRRKGRKVLFGMNACLQGQDGKIRVGDIVNHKDD